jgi:hypothetical protein
VTRLVACLDCDLAPDSRALHGYEDVRRRDADWIQAFVDVHLEPVEVSEASGKPARARPATNGRARPLVAVGERKTRRKVMVVMGCSGIAPVPRLRYLPPG